MPRWFVQLVGERMDLTEFPRCFPSGPVYAVEEKGTVYLTGTAFETFSDAKAVREEARKRLQELSAIISLDWPALRPPTVGGVERENERGGRDVDVLLEGIEMRIRPGSVGLTVGRSNASGVADAVGGPPQEPRLTPAQRMLSRTTQTEQLRRALRLMSRKPLDPNRLYKIVETIERSLGCTADRAGLCSDNERERFRNSVNCDEVMGDDARHAAGKFQPPKHPMDIDEATRFVRRLVVTVLTRP